MKHHSIFRGISATRKLAAVLITLAVIASTFYTNSPMARASGFSLIVLSQYNKTLDIGQSFYLVGIASNGKTVKWKSSSSRIASVNTYGQVTAKKAGTCKITGKTSSAEASCHITVRKTTITLSAGNVTMENGASFRLRGSTSNGAALGWKSSKSSVATIDENGNIEARKVGETMITASADGTKKTCKVTVKKPKVTLNQTTAVLYRTRTLRLTAKVSSGRSVAWKSKKSSVATVDDKGLVTARKHGTAIITAKVDGVAKECEVTVRSPEIKLNKEAVSIKKGKTLTLTASVSSGISPIWSSSKTSVAKVDKTGKVTAVRKGSCYIYASEDGTKEGCHVTVTG